MRLDRDALRETPGDLLEAPRDERLRIGDDHGITRVAADTATGLRLTATVLSADVATSVAHGSPAVLAWPDDAVRALHDTPPPSPHD